MEANLDESYNYSVKELAFIWNLDAETVRRISSKRCGMHTSVLRVVVRKKVPEIAQAFVRSVLTRIRSELRSGCVKEFELAGEVEHGEALYIAGAPVSLPPKLVEEYELVYRSALPLDSGKGTSSSLSLEITHRRGSSSSR